MEARKTTKSDAAPFDQMPDIIILLILSFGSVLDIGQLSRTCSRIRNICSQKSFWKQIPHPPNETNPLFSRFMRGPAALFYAHRDRPCLHSRIKDERLIACARSPFEQKNEEPLIVLKRHGVFAVGRCTNILVSFENDCVSGAISDELVVAVSSNGAWLLYRLMSSESGVSAELISFGSVIPITECRHPNHWIPSDAEMSLFPMEGTFSILIDRVLHVVYFHENRTLHVPFCVGVWNNRVFVEEIFPYFQIDHRLQIYIPPHANIVCCATSSTSIAVLTGKKELFLWQYQSQSTWKIVEDPNLESINFDETGRYLFLFSNQFKIDIFDVVTKMIHPAVIDSSYLEYVFAKDTTPKKLLVYESMALITSRCGVVSIHLCGRHTTLVKKIPLGTADAWMTMMSSVVNSPMNNVSEATHLSSRLEKMVKMCPFPEIRDYGKFFLDKSSHLVRCYPIFHEIKDMQISKSDLGTISRLLKQAELLTNDMRLKLESEFDQLETRRDLLIQQRMNHLVIMSIHSDATLQEAITYLRDDSAFGSEYAATVESLRDRAISFVIWQYRENRDQKTLDSVIQILEWDDVCIGMRNVAREKLKALGCISPYYFNAIDENDMLDAMSLRSHEEIEILKLRVASWKPVMGLEDLKEMRDEVKRQSDDLCMREGRSEAMDDAIKNHVSSLEEVCRDINRKIDQYFSTVFLDDDWMESEEEDEEDEDEGDGDL